jgi:hypothetical protein
MTDVLNLPVALETIRSNDKYREEFTVIAQDVRADIVSFKENPNCGCRRKITEFITNNKETEPLKAFLETWKPQIPKLFISEEEFAAQQAAMKEAQEKARKNFEEQRKLNPQAPPVPPVGPDGKPIHPKNMVGHVVEIPASPGEYKTLIEHAQKERWIYRGLSLKDAKATDGSAVWQVFFF